MLDAVVAGHLCVDIIPRITDPATAGSDNFLAPGRLTEVGEAVLSTGGAVSNTGISMHRLGLDVRLVARIGDDLIGNLTREIVGRHAAVLTENLAVGRGEPSSYTVVISAPGMDRTFLHCPGTNNTFGPEDVPDRLLSEARLLHFGYPPLMRRMFADGGAELAALLSRAKALGVTTSLDMAMPDPTRPSGQADWPHILALALPHVDLFAPSVEELLYMLRLERFEELRRTVGQARMLGALAPAEVSDLAQQTLALGAQVLLIKLGHRGVYFRSGALLRNMGRGAPLDTSAWARHELWAPCFRVNVVSTLGAGDATIAGFLAALLKGQSAEDAVVSAAAVGACNVEADDATSGVRSWEATRARIQAGWERLDTPLDAPGWRWDSQLQLWHGPSDGKEADRCS